MLEAISTVSLLAAEEPTFGFLQSDAVFYPLLLGAVVAGYFLAKAISKSLTLTEYGGRLGVVLVSLLIAALVIFAQWPPRFGVDLRGGINMIGSLNLEALDDSNGRDVPTAESVIPALMQRVNPSGTKEIMIRPLGEDKIEVTMPTVDKSEAEKIWQRLVSTGELEFRIVASPQNHQTAIQAATTQALSNESKLRRSTLVKDSDGKTIAKWVGMARVFDDNKRQILEDAPIKYIPNRGAMVRNAGNGRLVNLLAVPFQGDPDNHGKQLAEWAAEQGIKRLELLVVMPEESSNVTGQYLTSIQSSRDEKGLNAVNFSLDFEGGRRMGKLTKENIDRPLGIVLDNEIHSAPNINSKINTRGTITGQFTQREIDDLIINLKSGKLSVALNKEPISTDFIESTLGNELKQKGIFAIGVSLLLVLVFMVFYYRFAGVVASIALVLNLVLILALVMSIEYPFTLTGLAGLVLTVGMSVDANVLIFERIREELDRGAALRMAIRNGFDKATTTIVDANVTTLITAFVLYAMGTEQIKGFAVTLILGILISMFTAIYVSRLIFDIWERKRWLKELSMTRIMEKTKIGFIEKVRMTGLGSLALIALGVVSVYLLGGRILDQDLRGGSTARMVLTQKMEQSEVQGKLDELDLATPWGEPVEFEVSKFTGGDNTDMDGRKYKVDSNLPAYEGEGERFKELDEVLEDTFGDLLIKHNVEIEGLKPAVQPVSGEKKTEEEGDTPVGMQWRALPPATVASLTTSFVTYQESETVENATEENATQENEGGEAAEPQEGADAAAGGIQEGGVDEAAQEVEPAVIGDVTVTRKMTVKPEILGKSLAALIIDKSKELNLGLSEDQVTVSTPDVLDGESSLSTVSQDWEVKMVVSAEEDADAILSAWAVEFNQQAWFPTSSKVGGQIAGETAKDAGIAILISLIGIIGYCWIRFQNLAFGLAAVIALVHDVLIVVGAIAISHWLTGLSFLGIEDFKISLEIIAALLTVIGYSLNDTIVVFDRIREVRGKRTEITADMINTSISQTLSRTILTSVTTFIVVFILYWFGGDAIHGFAFALVVGVLVGTYSSIFVASPALLWLMNTVGLNPGEVDPEVAKA